MFPQNSQKIRGILKLTYSRRDPHRFDVFINMGTRFEFYKTCDPRSDYIKELGFKNPDINAFIEMRVKDMF